MRVVAVMMSIPIAALAALLAFGGLVMAFVDDDGPWPGLAVMIAGAAAGVATIAFLRGSRHGRVFLAGLHVIGAVACILIAFSLMGTRSDDWPLALLAAGWCALGAFAFVARATRRMTREPV